MSWKHTKGSQIDFTVTSIALSLVHLGSRLLGRPAQFLMDSPSTLIGVRPENKNDRGAASSRKEDGQSREAVGFVYESDDWTD